MPGNLDVKRGLAEADSMIKRLIILARRFYFRLKNDVQLFLPATLDSSITTVKQTNFRRSENAMNAYVFSCGFTQISHFSFR